MTSAKNDTRNLRVVRSLKSVAAGARGGHLYLSCPTKPSHNIVSLPRTHSVNWMILCFSFNHYFKNIYTFRYDKCLLLKESFFIIYVPLSLSLPSLLIHTHAFCIHGLRSDSCHADLRGRARSLSKNKYKRNTADGRRRASRKSARLINTARCNGTSCLLRTRDASVSQYYLNLPFYAFSYGHVPVQWYVLTTHPDYFTL